MVNDTEESRATVLDYMQPVLNMTPDITPIGLGLFTGSLDPDRRTIMAGGPQGDYRDWEVIRAWGQEIRAILLADNGIEQLALAETVLSYTDMSYTDLSHLN